MRRVTRERTHGPVPDTGDTAAASVNSFRRLGDETVPEVARGCSARASAWAWGRLWDGGGAPERPITRSQIASVHCTAGTVLRRCGPAAYERRAGGEFKFDPHFFVSAFPAAFPFPPPFSPSSHPMT